MNCEVARHLLHERVVLDGTGAAGDPDAARGLDEHLAGCTACAEERESLMALSAELPAAFLTPSAPDAGLRERLLTGTRHGRALPSFAGALARLFDLPVADARTLLGQLESLSAWRDGVVPGNWMRPVRPGAKLGDKAIGMLLRTQPGVTLPRHGHAGAERTFVMQGGYRDSSGTEVWAGEYSDMPAGAEHDLFVLPPVDCIAAVLVHGGVYLAR
jgi:putative transcriptional regulator